MVIRKKQWTISNVSKANHVASCSDQLLEVQLQHNELLPTVEPELQDLKIDLQSLEVQLKNLKRIVGITT